jgi:acetyl esterase/lipase
MKKIAGAWLTLAGSMLLSGCVGLLNASIPTDGYRVIADVKYGDHARHGLDVYVPEGLVNPAPVILFFYGGSWQSGNKHDYRFVGQALASRGFVTVIADYRLYPEVFFPDFMDDAAKAFVFVHRHIADYGGDRNKIFVAGHSAGAFNAMMLAADGSYIAKAGGNNHPIRGAIGIAGPYDFLPMTDTDIIAIFSKKPEAQTQPITFVTAAMPPVFLATGTDDTTVLPRNSERMAAKIETLGGDVTLKHYEGVGHIGIVLSLANGFRSKAPLLDDIADFVHSHTK